MTLRLRALPAVLALVLVLVASSGRAASSPAAGGTWTVLVYHFADTDLEQPMLQDLEEMMQAGSGHGLNLVVQVDRAEGHYDGPAAGLPDFTTTKRVVVTAAGAQEIADLGETNMGDPAVLADFIKWGLATYPADRVMLMFSDHGGAWPGFGGDESTPDHDMLPLSELSQGIAVGLEGSGRDKFDIIGYDACLMATWETAVTMQPYAHYMIASEELEPGHGWDQAKFAPAAAGADPVALGKSILEGFKGQAAAQGTSREITLSLMNLDKLDALTSALSTFNGGALATATDEVLTALGRSREGASRFGDNPNPAQATNMIDLGDLMTALAAAGNPEAQGVLDALGQVIVHQVRGEAFLNVHGMSIYFPPAAEFLDARYMELPGAGPWASVLQTYFTGGAAISDDDKPGFANADNLADVTFDNGIYTITGALRPGTEDNIVEATMFFGTLEDNVIALLGDQSAEFNDDGTVTGDWDRTVMKVSDGTTTAYAYLSAAIDDEAGVVKFSSPMMYYPPDDGEAAEVLYSIVFDATTDEVLEETFYVESEGDTWGELLAEPGSVVQPIIPVMNIDTEEVTWITGMDSDDEALDATVEWQIDFEDMEDEVTAFLMITATDFGGNDDTVVWVEEQ